MQVNYTVSKATFDDSGFIVISFSETAWKTTVAGTAGSCVGTVDDIKSCITQNEEYTRIPIV